ncbi:MAG: hypothetical protein H0T68_11745, partial [Gemmatimonadales bacterium]|nr:hypothetical protein [Gemmatimonadales bacterium]
MAAPPAAAQFDAPAVVVRTSPVTPARGRLGWIEVVPSGGAVSRPLHRVEGEAADEPLHFSVAPNGAFKALFGLPVEGPDSVELSLRLEREGRTDTTLLTL